MKYTLAVVVLLTGLVGPGVRAHAQVNDPVPSSLSFFISGVRDPGGIEGARIEIPAFDVNLTTTERGVAWVDGLPASSDPNCPIRADVIIRAEGYGDFTFKDLPLSGGVSYLTPTLRDEPVVNDFTDRPRALAGVECPADLPGTGASTEAGSGARSLSMVFAVAGLALIATGAGALLLLRRKRPVTGIR